MNLPWWAIALLAFPGVPVALLSLKLAGTWLLFRVAKDPYGDGEPPRR